MNPTGDERARAASAYCEHCPLNWWEQLKQRAEQAERALASRCIRPASDCGLRREPPASGGTT